MLRRDGALVPASVCNDNIAEVWDMIGVAEPRDPHSFTRETGEELLAKRFASVERRDVDAELVFPDTDSIRTFVASTIDRAHLAPEVPEVAGPFPATARHVVFVAKGLR